MKQEPLLSIFLDGEEKWVRPHFTFYGYRYVKVEGNTQALRKEDYQAAVLYSENGNHRRNQNH